MKKTGKFGDCAMHASMLIKMVEKHFGISKERLISKTRKGEIIQLRSICYYLLRKYNAERFTLADIGYQFGGKDHATILSATKTNGSHEAFYASNTCDYRIKLRLIEEEYVAKMEGENIDDDNVVKMIMAIERIEEDLALVKRNLIRSYADSKVIDPVIQERIESLSKISHDEQANISEKISADGIHIPGSEQ